MANTGGLLAELKRRNVNRMSGLYAVGAWLGVQIGDTLLPVFEAPPWAMKALVITLIVGFLPAMVFAWVFEITPDGLRNTAMSPLIKSRRCMPCATTPMRPSTGWSARVGADPGIGNTLIDPLVMGYKTDPRLAAFCAKVGLPPPTISETKGI